MKNIIISIVLVFASMMLNAQSITSVMDSVANNNGTVEQQMAWQKEILVHHEDNQLYAALDTYVGTLLGNNNQAYLSFCWYMASHYLYQSNALDYAQCISNIQSITAGDTLTYMRILYYEVEARLTHVTTADTYQISVLDSNHLTAIALSNTIFSEQACFILQEYYNIWPCMLTSQNNARVSNTPNSPTRSAVVSQQASFKLNESIPNPSKNRVSIPYEIAENVTEIIKGKITIYNIMTGQSLLSQSITEKNGKVDFNISSLGSGVYTYTLEVNGEIKDVKRMVIMK